MEEKWVKFFLDKMSARSPEDIREFAERLRNYEYKEYNHKKPHKRQRRPRLIYKNPLTTEQLDNKIDQRRLNDTMPRTKKQLDILRNKFVEMIKRQRKIENGKN